MSTKFGFEDLPSNWKQQAIPLSKGAANQFQMFSTTKSEILIDDNCPLQLSVLVFDKKGKVFRLKDGNLSARIMRTLELLPEIQMASLKSLSLPQKASFNTN